MPNFDSPPRPAAGAHLAPVDVRSAFTIVELLVVLAVIAALVGLLLPALSGTVKSSRKLEDLNRARQIGMAWTMYAQQNDDGLLPGYLSLATQDLWNVHYRYADGTLIDPSPDDDEPVPGEPETTNQFEPAGNITGPWSWRLLPYLEYDVQLVMSHRVDEYSAFDPVERAMDISNEPAFGYNGLFLGGFYAGRRAWFDDTRTNDDEEQRLSVLSKSLGAIRRPADLVAFTSSAERGPGVHRYRATVDDFDGSFIVLPPMWGEQRVWGTPEVAERANLDTLQVGNTDEWFGEFAAFG